MMATTDRDMKMYSDLIAASIPSKRLNIAPTATGTVISPMF